MSWVQTLELWGGILIAVGAGVWAWKTDYITWEDIKDSVSIDGLKETAVTAFTQPKFVALYLIFILFPVWVLTDLLKSALPVVPFYQKIILSIAGIWMISLVMNKRGVTE
jgi:hypothetical protein